MTKFTYIGSGGKKPRTPVITNDNLFSKDKVEILLGVGEGPLQGLEEGLKSFFAGDVPLNDKDGQPIIKDLVATPYQGISTPQVINFALGGESANTTVGVNILQKSPVVRYTPENFRGKINKLDIRLNIAQLFREEANGDVLNNTAEFRIEYKTARGTDPWVVLDFTNATPNGPNPFPNLSGITFQVATHTDSKNKYQLIGKTGSGFVIDFRVTVAPITDDDYIIRVTKFNPDTDNSVNLKVACDIVFDSFQTIYQASRSFTNTALMHVTGRANDQFSDIPDFYGIYKGLITKVPSNRIENAVGSACYPTTWNGVLTPAWHSNPAWVLYDLLDNPRYGMRRYAPTLNIYTQDFYEAGVYCDNGVSNYFGTGDEKRYTMNITLAENQNGWETLQNLAGAFDAVLYDDGEGNVRLKVDKWVEPRVLFTPETVTIDGINYSFTDINTQYNSITVSFTNPERGWQETRLKVKNDTFIDLNGEIPLDFVAVGCTSESEALRRAQARLLTANHEKTIAAFTTTRLGLILDPLEIVYLADPLMGWGVSGRISHTSGNFIYLRDGLAHILVSTPADIYIQTTTGIYQGTVTVTQTNPAILLVTSAGFETLDLPELTQFCLGNFTTSSGSLIRGPKPFRITAIEPSKDYNTFQLTALEVNPDKYDILGNPDHPEILIDTDNYTGLNLRQLFEDKNHSLSRQYSGVTFTFDGTLEQQANSFLLLCAADVNDYALTVGDWTGLLPVGVKPKLVFKGAVKVMGRGGKGGDGGDLIPISPIYEGYYEYYYGRDLGRPDYSQVSIMGGHRGEDGGNAVFTDYPVDIELAAGANVELIGGYGGGYGSDAGAVLIQEQWLLETVQNVKNCVKRVQGSGGSGGWPFGQGGSAGGIAQNPVHAVPSGASGDKENAGGLQTANSPFMVVRPMQYSGGQGAIQHSLGSAGRPLSALGNPVPYLLFDFPPNTELLTYVGDRTIGEQGLGVINHGNMTITTLGAGSVLTYNTISGYTTLTG